MPAYHSVCLAEATGLRVISKLVLAPLRTKQKGPAPPATGNDIIDETLGFFKANILFRNFNVKGDADRLLIYATLYVSACLNKIVKKNKTEATALITGMGLENNFALPGDAKFPLGGLVSKPASTQEADTLRQYLAQMRQEIGIRLIEKVYARDNTQPDKWWMCFQKRKFLNMEL